MHMHDCPKFDSCNAPICPLDPDWKRRSHLDGERVCYYLTEYAKQAARPILRGGLAVEHYEAIKEGYPKVIAAHPRIKRQLERSSTSNPRSRVLSIERPC
jgi:hypothetical protein